MHFPQVFSLVDFGFCFAAFSIPEPFYVYTRIRTKQPRQPCLAANEIVQKKIIYVWCFSSCLCSPLENLGLISTIPIRIYARIEQRAAYLSAPIHSWLLQLNRVHTNTHTLWNWKANRKCKRLCGFDVSLHNEQPSIFRVSPKFAPRILYHFVSYLMEDIRWKIFQLMLYIVGAVSIRFFMCSVCLCVTVCAHIWARSVYFETVWRLCHYHTEKYHCE